MRFIPGELYHVYNRGNNQQHIFFNNSNYQFFLRKIKNELTEYCDILTYCLMPNHYHLLIRVKDESFDTDFHPLVRKIGTLQSSYTRAINIQNKSKGSLFQQKAKAKHLSGQDQAFICFHYIHQNPVKAGLVNDLGDWEFSSYNDYVDCKSGMVSRYLAYELLDIPNDDEGLKRQSMGVMPDDIRDKIF
ncbi:MAG: transposase [Bacteroidota bacterium]